jgi:hypothetical protein
MCRFFCRNGVAKLVSATCPLTYMTACFLAMLQAVWLSNWIY